MKILPSAIRHLAFRAIALLLAAALAAPSFAQQPFDPVATNRATVDPGTKPVLAPNGMVSSQEALATRIGVEILNKGGNAVDAAVAVGFALAVTLPRAGNLGGGGFFVIWLAEAKQSIAIDFREVAPAAIRRDSFLGANGKPDPHKSLHTGLATGVPGTVAGLALALEKYGSRRFTLADLLAPAIKLANEGVPLENDLAISITRYQQLLGRWPSSQKVFFRDGKPLQRGDRLVQRDLAATLQAIAEKGPEAFYRGVIAERIARAVQDAGGVMTVEDLANYRADIRETVRGTYRGYDIVSMPPPSSGGGLLIQILNILEGFDLRKMGRDSPDTIHVMVEAMKRAFADRAEFFGDPDYVKVPLTTLLSKEYAEKLRAGIDLKVATPSEKIRAGAAPKQGGDNTTHYSVVDRDGNAVAATVTLNFSYGLGLVAEGTGVLLNNEMDDFALAPGVPNAYGLVGGEANAPGPNKKPLSSMTPTILVKDGKAFLVTGSPGGSRIITTVLRVVTGVVDFDLDIAQAIALPRFHHQWQPDVLSTEPGLPDRVLRILRERGHNVQIGTGTGSANSILRVQEGWSGAADRRYLGALAGGY